MNKGHFYSHVYYFFFYSVHVIYVYTPKSTRKGDPPAPGSSGGSVCSGSRLFSLAFLEHPAVLLYLSLLYLSPISLTSLVPWHKSWSEVVRNQTHHFTLNKLSPCRKATERHKRQRLNSLKKKKMDLHKNLFRIYPCGPRQPALQISVGELNGLIKCFSQYNFLRPTKKSQGGEGFFLFHADRGGHRARKLTGQIKATVINMGVC